MEIGREVAISYTISKDVAREPAQVPLLCLYPPSPVLVTRSQKHIRTERKLDRCRSQKISPASP
jgi:hypothetical protein